MLHDITNHDWTAVVLTRDALGTFRPIEIESGLHDRVAARAFALRALAANRAASVIALA